MPVAWHLCTKGMCFGRSWSHPFKWLRTCMLWCLWLMLQNGPSQHSGWPTSTVYYGLLRQVFLTHMHKRFQCWKRLYVIFFEGWCCHYFKLL